MIRIPIHSSSTKYHPMNYCQTNRLLQPSNRSLCMWIVSSSHAYWHIRLKYQYIDKYKYPKYSINGNY